MSERTIDSLEPRIGETNDSVQGLSVEPGKVAEFAAAVGHDEPMFKDSDVAAQLGFERIPAPPTFTRTSLFPRYRPPGTGRLGFDVGFDKRYELHGEQSYVFERPVFVGDTLSATTTLTNAYEREGSQGGIMTFAILETKFTDETGDPIVNERQTLIESDGPLSGDKPDNGDVQGATPDGARIRLEEGKFDSVDSVETINIGDTGPILIVENLAPQDFVRYAGASGDFNPIHFDDQYARELGNAGVFGQGMLTAGYAGRYVTDWFGIASLQQFRTRFTARVWPGDTLTIQGDVTGIDAQTITAELSVIRQTGETVLLGDIMIQFPEINV